MKTSGMVRTPRNYRRRCSPILSSCRRPDRGWFTCGKGPFRQPDVLVLTPACRHCNAKQTTATVHRRTHVEEGWNGRLAPMSTAASGRDTIGANPQKNPQILEAV